MWVYMAYEAFVSTEKCVEVTGLNKYDVAVLVAKRVRELASGAVPTVPRGISKKFINLALSELVSDEFNVNDLEARFLNSLAVTPRDRSFGKDVPKFSGEFKSGASGFAENADRSGGNIDAGQDFDGAVKSGESLGYEDSHFISYSEEEMNDPGSS